MKKEEDTSQYKNFHQNIRVIRALNQMSTQEFADKTKLRHAKRVNDLEEGRVKPSLEEAMSISKAFDLPAEKVLFGLLKIEISFES